MKEEVKIWAKKVFKGSKIEFEEQLRVKTFDGGIKDVLTVWVWDLNPKIKLDFGKMPLIPTYIRIDIDKRSLSQFQFYIQ